MSRHAVLLAAILCCIALAVHAGVARAHEEITVGDYTVEIGWQNEPPQAWEENALVLHIVHTNGGQPVVDAAGLTVTLAYGGQEKLLALQPMEEAGTFSAPVVPTLAGQYAVFLGGTLGGAQVDAVIEPEEVGFGNGDRSAVEETQLFPQVTPAPQDAGSAEWNWVLYVGIGIGLLVLLFAPFQILRPRR